MLITNSAPSTGAYPIARGVTLTAASESPDAAPSETFTPSSEATQPKERYPAWTPLANAGVVGLLVAVPAFAGAAGNAVFGASPYLPVGVSALAGAGAGTWAYKSSMKEFRGHPVLVGLSTLGAGVVAAVAAPFLSIPGAAYGWKGAAVATAVAAIGTGVVSAFGIHHANKKIDQQNAALGLSK
jgi:hypothetical protein